MMSLDFGMAKKYVDDLSVNTKRGIRTKLEKGEWPNAAPLGYLNDKINKKIIIDLQKGHYITELFNLYATGGYSIKEITNLIYQKGFRTRPGKKVTKSVIHRILTNRLYYGIMERDGKFYPANHEPLITKEIFNRAGEVLSGKNNIRKQKHDFPHRGFMKCNVCGCALTGTIKKGHIYYYCTNGKGKCEEHKKYLRSEKIDEMIMEIFENLSFDKELVEIMYSAAKEKSEGNKSGAEQIINTLKEQLKIARIKQERLLDSYLNGLTPEDVYKAKMEGLKRCQVETEMQLKQTETNKDNHCDTLELTKQVFLFPNLAKKEFLNKDNFGKRKIIENLLWNLNIENQNLATYKLKEPFQIMAGAPKTHSFNDMLRGWDSNPRPID
ncbi:MAG: hypothetical protein COU29_00370 [Candidatus Magasanikbacteria bacterium CG10_big_fil_rev_8_21_14_0_10_36_32]|uniref:Recombinase domain-containing protein n=1 Tax=Candidatus Magasanikbacteria bacterium CG10_big_fil_rev_8_21_14_0_10_36_32 TaxID=1974646 RepID=A0A2M6W7U2_9BACT|nr:MAG: hypothetical protein COU29_00370 [Candidatus Magasanikbacteria bacterium CG10_big_fil_rev_8_21_14_0_10_36_32]